MIVVGLIGPGNLGRTFAAALPAGLYHLGPIAASSWVSARKAARELRRGTPAHDLVEFAACDCILLASPTDRLEEVVARLAAAIPLKGKTVLHTAGVDDSRLQAVLATLGAIPGCIFPLTVLRRPAADLGGVCCAISGPPSALRFARRFVRDCGGEPVAIDPSAMPRVAAAASLFREPLLALTHLASRLLTDAGLPRRRAAESLRALALTALDHQAHSTRSARPEPLEPAELEQRLAELGGNRTAGAVLRQEALRWAQRVLAFNDEDSMDATSPPASPPAPTRRADSG